MYCMTLGALTCYKGGDHSQAQARLEGGVYGIPSLAPLQGSGLYCCRLPAAEAKHRREGWSYTVKATDVHGVSKSPGNKCRCSTTSSRRGLARTKPECRQEKQKAGREDYWFQPP
ncbi:hypothetical protein GDO78_004794 [Eleutherodactylus coqui]|uniref:Uncharacterized protein n=1 Tax=Eleutherodactylus coqui TaxID=57060 RepID=A0A8J6ESA2_ELECQ|nr:hypothetical protein GDO78_004794 [Eleutherodactylus coqui]